MAPPLNVRALAVLLCALLAATAAVVESAKATKFPTTFPTKRVITVAPSTLAPSTLMPSLAPVTQGPTLSPSTAPPSPSPTVSKLVVFNESHPQELPCTVKFEKYIGLSKAESVNKTYPLAYAEDGNTLVAGSRLGYKLVFKRAGTNKPYKLVQRLPFGVPLCDEFDFSIVCAPGTERNVAISPDASTIAMSIAVPDGQYWRTTTVVFYNWNSKKKRYIESNSIAGNSTTLPGLLDMDHMIFSANGKRLLLALADEALVFTKTGGQWNKYPKALGGESIPTKPFYYPAQTNYIDTATISPDGTAIVLLRRGLGSLFIFNGTEWNTGKLLEYNVWPNAQASTVQSSTFFDNGNHLLVVLLTNFDGSGVVWDSFVFSKSNNWGLTLRVENAFSTPYASSTALRSARGLDLLLDYMNMGFPLRGLFQFQPISQMWVQRGTYKTPSSWVVTAGDALYLGEALRWTNVESDGTMFGTGASWAMLPASDDPDPALEITQTFNGTYSSWRCPRLLF